MQSEICGVYFFKSPYHQSKRYLPFVIHAIHPHNPSAPIEVSTVEFKGWTRYDVRAQYTTRHVRELLMTGKLKPADKVARSSVKGPDLLLWTLATSGQRLDLTLL